MSRELEDLIRQEQLRMLAQSKEPLDILRRYHILMAQVYETLTELTMGEDLDKITDYLDGIEELDSQIREYLYEEAGLTLGHYDERHGKIVFDSLPPDLRLVPTGHGFVVENLPVWMLGHGAKKKYHPLYHKNRPFVRKRQLWYWLFHKLKWDYLNEVMYWENSLLPKEPPGYARMLIVIRSGQFWEVKDLDHYLPTLEFLVNAMVANGLIWSDRPGRFSYAVSWTQDSSGVANPSFDLYVETSDNPFPTWIIDVERPEPSEQSKNVLKVVNQGSQSTDADDSNTCPYCGSTLQYVDHKTEWHCPGCGLRRRRRQGSTC
ncbi:MAG: transposase [Alicyclobacillus macrosporangiidus]|uniref:hypothetical protein n=1 Tax=Alicyclobacillus macrosporangiidus TaxID=392015 RepID=UPI0026EC4FE8|nr:hypothetical protein [Alicyclobacillus macrosporangiidus]MCL6599565.1 transposase [Alicyclobacillus macrosporangiidus]